MSTYALTHKGFPNIGMFLLAYRKHLSFFECDVKFLYFALTYVLPLAVIRYTNVEIKHILLL